MPKAKPTQVIVHRIELQEKERELLEPIMKAKEVEQFAKAGAMVVGAAALGATAYATWWTLDTIHNWGQKAGDRLEVIKGRILDDVGEGENKDVPWWYKFRINYLFGDHL